jgi:hypothetical protein
MDGPIVANAEQVDAIIRRVNPIAASTEVVKVRRDRVDLDDRVALQVGDALDRRDKTMIAVICEIQQAVDVRLRVVDVLTKDDEASPADQAVVVQQVDDQAAALIADQEASIKVVALDDQAALAGQVALVVDRVALVDQDQVVQVALVADRAVLAGQVVRVADRAVLADQVVRVDDQEGLAAGQDKAVRIVLDDPDLEAVVEVETHRDRHVAGHSAMTTNLSQM